MLSSGGRRSDFVGDELHAVMEMKHQGDDAEPEVLLDAGQPLGFGEDTGLFLDFAPQAGVDGLVEFQDPAADFTFRCRSVGRPGPGRRRR